VRNLAKAGTRIDQQNAGGQQQPPRHPVRNPFSLNCHSSCPEGEAELGARGGGGQDHQSRPEAFYAARAHSHMVVVDGASRSV
jgi:hypothetical protein